MRRLQYLILLLLLAVTGAYAGPKNIIIMISDGCGYNHINAASLYQFGQPNAWTYQAFPVKYAVSTFPAGGSYDPALAWTDFEYVKKNVTDSAAAATALATGVKTYNGAIGVGPDKKPFENIMEAAKKTGRATGIITSVPFSHATPAGFIAHNEGRGNYADIAQEMLNSKADVIMGAGNPWYDNDGHKLATPKYTYVGKAQWEALTSGQRKSWQLIQTKGEFEALMHGPTPRRVLGVAQVSDILQEGRSGDPKAPAFAVPFNSNIPTLSQMALGAINVLDNQPQGFCLMIEGGAIDWAAHSNLSGRMIEEEIDFSKTVETVCKWIETHGGWDETLLIVTADHETGYLTGPGSAAPKDTTQAASLLQLWPPLVNNGAGKMPGMEWHYGSHTNSLVALFAKGNGSEAFHRFPRSHDPRRGDYIDNTCIAKAMFEALR